MEPSKQLHSTCKKHPVNPIFFSLVLALTHLHSSLDYHLRGGRLHKVTDGLLRQHKNTVLGSLGLRALKQEGHNEPIFVDRDGDIFNYVLNYMREGEIDLPMSIPKSSFLAELNYYQINFGWGVGIRQFGAPSPLAEIADVAVIALAGFVGLIAMSLSSMKR